MKLRHVSFGSEVDVPEDKAKKLLSSGSWVRMSPEIVSDAPTIPGGRHDPTPVVEDAPEPSQVEDDGSEEILAHEEAVKEVVEEQKFPTIPEMRKWALEQGIEGVKEKGKLSKAAIDAYLEAHKD